jgi:hypothetical protein
MRNEGENHGGHAAAAGQGYDPVKNFPVSKMNSVKVSNSYNRIRQGQKVVFQAADNLHGMLPWTGTFSKNLRRTVKSLSVENKNPQAWFVYTWRGIVPFSCLTIRSEIQVSRHFNNPPEFC